MSRDFHLFRRILANDLRLFLRSGKGAATHLGGMVLMIPLVGVMHLPVFMVMKALGRIPEAAAAEFAVVLLGALLFSAALQRALETLYNRGDLPLLLSSPVPLRVVVATRLVDIALTTVGGTALFLVPILNCAALLFGPRWLWGWAVWFAGTALLVPLALAATLALVRRIGARRTRTLVQLSGIVLGLGTFVGFQAANWITHSGRTPGPHLGTDWLGWFAVPPLTQAAAAAHGDPLWLGLLVLIGGVATFWALRRLTRSFAHGALAAGDDTGGERRSAGSAATAWRRRFEQPRWRVIVAKELRLVFRDPLLIARSSTQIITIVPALASAFLYRATVGLAGTALVGPGMVAVLLAALMTANDEAPVCTAASPLSRHAALTARSAAAALYPAMLGWVIAAVVLVLGEPFLAVVAALGGTLNSAAAAWLTSCTVRLHTAEERARNKQPTLLGQTLFSMVVGSLGAGGVASWVAGHRIAAIILLAVATAAAAAAGFLARPRRNWGLV